MTARDERGRFLDRVAARELLTPRGRLAEEMRNGPLVATGAIRVEGSRETRARHGRRFKDDIEAARKKREAATKSTSSSASSSVDEALRGAAGARRKSGIAAQLEQAMRKKGDTT